jgi:uncharacterized protein (DUF433 family)
MLNTPMTGGKMIQNLNRITFDPQVMGGKACIRGMRVTVSTVVGLVASGYSKADILKAYPYLEEEDIRQALNYAAWRVQEIEVPLSAYEISD